jgi:hypothetical protein
LPAPSPFHLLRSWRPQPLLLRNPQSHRAGVTAFAHIGGSIRAHKTLAAAEAAGIALILTSGHHFMLEDLLSRLLECLMD